MQGSLRELEQAVRSGAERLVESDAVARLWRRDASLWAEDAETAAKVENRLGWLTSLDAVDPEVLREFVSEVRAAGFRRVLLLGMGGSSLCPEVLRQCFGVAEGHLDLRVLDSTTPDAVRAARSWADAQQTLFLVASKSGTTAEVVAFENTFLAHCGDPGHFVAVTDPGTDLDRRSREGGWRRVFVNPADIGGRFSALSYFGLVPAALLGIDVARFLDSARRRIDECGPGSEPADNPGFTLGLALAEAARAGRNKMTLVFPDALAPFGNWVEQLVAESTGKQGGGILPVLDEILPPERWGADRLSVSTLLADDASGREFTDTLRASGQPLFQIDLDDVYDLAGEFFRWEVATAVCGAQMGINPFDEPNVTESKDRTNALLAGFAEQGSLARMDADLEDGGLSFVGDDGLDADDPAALVGAHLARAEPGEYVAILAYLHRTDEVHARLCAIRERVARHTGLPTTLGYGPRFLHSTGQLHKGGADSGVFLQITADAGEDLEVPGLGYGFATLVEAQARGDWGALADRGRRLLRCTCHADVLAGLAQLEASLPGGP